MKGEDWKELSKSSLALLAYTTQCHPLVNLLLPLVVLHDLLLSSPMSLVSWDTLLTWTPTRLRCSHVSICPKPTTVTWSHSTGLSTLLRKKYVVVSCPFIDKTQQLLVEQSYYCGEGALVGCRRSRVLGRRPS